MEPNNKEDAQRLWQRERQHMQETMRLQKEQMMEDKKWLQKEERLLVGNRASLALVNPLSVSLCPSSHQFNVTLEPEWNKAPLNRIKTFVLPRRPTSIKLNVTLITVEKKGPMSLFCKMNLPVLLQDPMGQDDIAISEVNVHVYKIKFQWD